MRKYNKEFKEETVKLSDAVGVKQVAAQHEAPYYSLAEWRQKRKNDGWALNRSKYDNQDIVIGRCANARCSKLEKNNVM